MRVKILAPRPNEAVSQMYVGELCLRLRIPGLLSIAEQFDAISPPMSDPRLYGKLNPKESAAYSLLMRM